MLVGHVGVGLAAKALEPRLNLGTLVAAALFLDIVFWILALAGLEAVHVPHDYAARHFLTFDFPWSHSLAMACVWSLGFAVAWAFWGSRRARRLGALWDGSALLAVVVFSHWLADLLVHVPEMPLAPGVGAFGFGLWQHQPFALVLELVFALVGVVAIVWRTALAPLRKGIVCVLTILLAALTAMGAFAVAPPPDPAILALSSLAIMLAVIAVCAWCDRAPRSITWMP